MFLRSGNPFLTFSKSCHVRVTSKIKSTSGSTSDCCVNRGYCGFGCMYSCYFINLYVFEVEESVSRRFKKLPCSGDLENPGQLPVLQALDGTDD